MKTKRLLLNIFALTLCVLVAIPKGVHAVEDIEIDTGVTDIEESTLILQTETETTDEENSSIREDSGVNSERILRGTEFPKKVQTRIDMIRSNINERRTANRVRVQEDVRLRVENSLDKTINQFEAAIQRLTSLSERLEERLVSMEQRGLDMSVAFDALELAQIEIETSAGAVATTATSALEALSSETPRANHLVVRTSLTEARISLRKARESLMQAVAAARSGVSPENVSASAQSNDQ
jgi:hypothetical protein